MDTAVKVLEQFIRNHMKYWEDNNIDVGHLLSDNTDSECINEMIKTILLGYKNNIVNWDWPDYSEATKTLCCISGLVSIDQLNRWQLENTFFDTIRIGIGMAGDEVGCDYKGIRTIKNYASLLPEEYLMEILIRNESLDGGQFHSYFRSTILRTIIESYSFQPNTTITKEILKFRFSDSYMIIGIILKRIRSFLASKYPSYHYVTITELNKQLDDKISDTNFLFALIDDNDCIYVKLDRVNFDLYLSITRNPDPNKMDYIFDSCIFLVDDEILITFDNETNNHYANVNIQNHQPEEIHLPFSFDNWDQLQFEKIPALTDFLLKRLEISEKSRERFDLICYVGIDLNGLSERVVYFRSDIIAELNGTEIILHDNEVPNKRPENFFGDTVNNVCAVIGPNGSGKTSVFHSILHNPVFGFDESESAGEKSFLLYRVGNNYYYSISSELNLANKSSLKLQETEFLTSDITICYISNTFDIFSIDLTSIPGENKEKNASGCFVDLSAVHQIQVLKQMQDCSTAEATKETDCLQRYKSHEKYRIQTLTMFLDRYAAEIGVDALKLKKVLNLKAIDPNIEKTMHFSSGEYARWSLFSKLLSVFYRDSNLENNPLPEIPKRDNYIILFDEAELYMHPEWQRKLINDIIVFLETINNKNQFFSNISLLFSSNSPFLMSDLPTDCIQLFEADENNQKSFGQNIYTILKDRFFMPNGTIGEFATKCINKALEVNENSTLKDKKYLAYIAEIVGDKLISYHLNEKSNEYPPLEGSDS